MIDLNELLFVCEDTARRKVVDADEIYKPDFATGRIASFSAEEAFTSAIKYVLREVPEKLYFLKGHREYSLERHDELSYLKKFLEEREGYETESLNLLVAQKVPDDCTILFITGPRSSFDEKEIQILKEYLQKGGRMLITLLPGSDCGLEKFLQAWGINYGRNLLLAIESLRFISFYPADYIFIERYPFHPINSKMRDIVTVFPFSCTVEPFKGHDKLVQAKVLIQRKALYKEDDLSFLFDPKKRYTPDPRKIKPGTYSIGVAVEAKSKDNKKARLIVFGSTNFLISSVLRWSNNFAYLINCLRWLTEKEKEITIPEKKFKLKPLILKAGDAKKLFWYSIAGLPSIGILLGLFVWYFRRK
jgi:hypothetical protein